MKKKADRSIAPRRPDFNRLYQRYSNEKYGARNGAEMFKQLDQVIKDYIEENTEASIKFQPYEEVIEEENESTIIPFILAIVTAQMKRVHRLVSINTKIHLHLTLLIPRF